MKITGLKCHLMTIDLRDSSIEWAGGSMPYWNTAIVEVNTDEGVTGLGEAYYPGLSAPRPTQAMTDNYASLLTGEDPRDIARLFHRMRSKSYSWGKAGLPLMIAGTIENALWDILGQSLGTPVYQLLGGRCHDGIVAYASGGNDAPPEVLTAEMKGYVERGFRAVKIRIGRSVKEDVAKVELCREALGPGVELMVDAVMGHNPRPWTAKRALECARAIEPYGITWFEDPVNNRDYAGCARVRSGTSIPIAAGESAVGLEEFKPFFRARGGGLHPAGPDAFGRDPRVPGRAGAGAGAPRAGDLPLVGHGPVPGGELSPGVCRPMGELRGVPDARDAAGG